MKHIKKFEKYYGTVDLPDLTKHILKFLENFRDTSIFKVDEEYNIEIDFWFIPPNTENRTRHCIFSFIKIDYYYGDPDKYFEFKLDTQAKRISYTNEETYNIILFIESIMNKYNKNQNMIAYSSITQIMYDISMENYNLYLDIKKYNL